MLTDRPLSAVLGEVAARRPAPGGGSSAALSCALGAALVAMAASFAMDSPGSEGGTSMAELHAEAERLRAAGLELVERELSSYAPVLESLQLPRADPARAQRIGAALAQATEAPLEIARLGAAVAELGGAVATDGSSHLSGDAMAGVLLAEAGCRAAGCLVQLNLRDAAAGDARLLELDALLDRARAARRRVARTLNVRT